MTPNSNIYTIGGTVQAGGGLYIERQADSELLALCRAGHFAYVLTARQLGKSSLMMATANKLTSEGVCPVIVDLSTFGSPDDESEWYLGILEIIDDDLELMTDLEEWWEEHERLSATQRFVRFFQKVVAEEMTTPVVIFLEEIDSTLILPFRNDFFAAIRALYNARAHVPALAPLTFVLIGVTTPQDLIDDPQRTPFNIGQRVDLTDFTLEEAAPLADGFGLPSDEAQQALKRVLKWTNGHPYFTQRLCFALAEEESRQNWSDSAVKRLVEGVFLGEKSAENSNLQFVRDMLTKRIPEPLTTLDVLSTYRAIRVGRRAVHDEAQSQVKNHLKLSGIVVREGDNVLRVRNRIYEQVFDGKWIKEQWPLNWWDTLAYKQISFLLLFLLILTSTYYFWPPRAAARYNESGFKHYSDNDFSSAERDYQWALIFDSDFPAAHYNLGLLYEDQGNFGLAKDEYQKAINGKLDVAYNNLSRLHILHDKYDEAIDVLTEGLPLAKDDQARYALHKNLGWAYFRLDENNKAHFHLQRAIQLDDLDDTKAAAYCLQAQVLDAQQSEPAKIDEAWEECLRYGDSSRPDEEKWIEMAIQHFNRQRSCQCEE